MNFHVFSGIIGDPALKRVCIEDTVYENPKSIFRIVRKWWIHRLQQVPFGGYEIIWGLGNDSGGEGVKEKSQILVTTYEYSGLFTERMYRLGQLAIYLNITSHVINITSARDNKRTHGRQDTNKDSLVGMYWIHLQIVCLINC